MEVYLYLSGSRVTGLSHIPCPGTIKVEVEETHEVVKNPFVFTYANGQLVKDVAFQNQKIQEREERDNKPTLEQEIAELKKQNADLAFQLMLSGVL